MALHVRKELEERINELATSSGSSVDEVVEAAIVTVYGAKPVNGAPPAEELISEEQHSAMMARLKEIQNLPREAPDDDFDVRDHDKLIYRIDE